MEPAHHTSLDPSVTGNLDRLQQDFSNPEYAARRLFAEMLGTFFLVLVAAGAGVVDAVSHGAVGRASAVVAPGLMVMAIILFMGQVSGAHLNPAVSLAFALRGNFPWGRVPAYVAFQFAGAAIACYWLRSMFGDVGALGATLPAPVVSDFQATAVEAVLTMGLVSVILGTASSAQNVGSFSAIAVGAYIALAGMWASPITGASMNPARSLGPDMARGVFTHAWVYVIGPCAGAALAVGLAWILRGPPSRGGTLAGQGFLGYSRPKTD